MLSEAGNSDQIGFQQGGESNVPGSEIHSNATATRVSLNKTGSWLVCSGQREVRLTSDFAGFQQWTRSS